MPNKSQPVLDLYAVFGNPIAHSKSPFLHSVFAEQTHQPIDYMAILAPLDQFEATIRQFISEGGRGANVTLPFKIEAFDLCCELTPRAEAAGAVNTLSFIDDHIYGDNTDGCGLVRDITENAGIDVNNKRILLIGAGGAARGVVLPLLECRPTELTIANRNSEKAFQLANEFKRYGKITHADFSKLDHQYDIVINATSSSIESQRPGVPDTIYRKGSLAYDMMYGTHPTPFMEHAAELGAKTRNGWGMLVEQAAEAFYVWRGVRPETGDLLVKK